MKSVCLPFAPTVCAALAQAGVVTTNNAAEVLAFQQGLSVQTFENVSGRTPLTVDAYPTSAVALDAAALVFDQVPGLQFSSGIKPGAVKAGLIRLEADNGGGDGGTHSNTALVGLTPDNATQFNRSELIEAYLPNKVSSLGFWLSPDLGKVQVYFLSSNFAFNRDETEELWESAVVDPGQFVGLSRDSADIGGLKVIALSDRGFAIDDLSFGGTGSPHPVPEPASAWLAVAGPLAWASAAYRSRRCAAVAGA